MAFSFQPKTVTDGLVLYLDAANTKSYPGSGTTWTDLSQTAITGSLVNGASFNSTNSGNIFFDGTNDYVSIGNSSIFKFTNNFTIDLWLKFSTVSGVQTIISNNEGGGYGIISNYDGGTRLETFFYISGSYYKAGDTTSNYITSSWFNVITTYDGSGIKFYRNGGIVESVTISGSVTTTSEPLTIGANPQSSGSSYVEYFSGSIAQVKLYNRALSPTEVLQNYNAICGRFGKTPTITDGDALSFVNAANISNETQQSAINTLVTDLKGAGLWSKMKAIYPFVGGTAVTHKWNLKDPRDVDAAFRLTFSGGWTHSSTGATPNGTNAFANTYLTPTSNLIENSTHLSYYSRTNNYKVSRDIGLYRPTTGLMSIAVGSLSDGVDKNYGGEMYSPSDWINVQPINDSTGYYVITRTANNYLAAYRNNTLTQSSLGNNPRTTTASGWSSCNINLYIGAWNEVGTAAQYGNKEAAFATIGDGLTNTDVNNLHTIVQKYQTTLGRQV